MKKIATALIFGALSLPALSTSATAGNMIANACMSSARGAAAPSLCGCIQNVADSMLSARQQVIGAQIFVEPHKSQEIRASANKSNAADQAFWETWRSFGATAAQRCQ